MPSIPTTDALPGLLERGWISVTGPGLIRCSGPFVALCDYFDAAFVGIARRRRAEPHLYPGIVSRKLLERFEYFSSFPGIATSAGDDHVLPPAVCYQTYAVFAGRVLEDRLYRVSVAGRCSRNEGARLTNSPERLRDFTMRELVFLGSAQAVERERRALMLTITHLAWKFRMQAALVAATDPFFQAPSRGKLVLQKLKQLKFELRAPFNGDGDLAIASFNHHEDFFTRRSNIRLAGGAQASSGCAAFGIERWTYVFLCQNGLDIAAWPAPIQRYVQQHATR